MPPIILVPDMDISTRITELRNALLDEIAEFIAARGIAETTFGLLAVNDGKFVGRLRSGENMTTALLARAHEFIRAERAKDRAERCPSI